MFQRLDDLIIRYINGQQDTLRNAGDSLESQSNTHSRLLLLQHLKNAVERPKTGYVQHTRTYARPSAEPPKPEAATTSPFTG